MIILVIYLICALIAWVIFIIQDFRTGSITVGDLLVSFVTALFGWWMSAIVEFPELISNGCRKLMKFQIYKKK